MLFRPRLRQLTLATAANADGIYSVARERTEIDGLGFRGEWAVTDNDKLALRDASTEGEYDSDDDDKVDSDLDGSNIAPDRINLSWERQWGAASACPTSCSSKPE